MAAVVVQDTEVQPLTHALDAVIRNASSRHNLWLPITTELHGYPIFHGKGEWSVLAGMARAQIGVYRETFSAIADHGAHIILRGVNKPGHEARKYADPWHPHKIVLQYVLEDVDQLAEREQQPALVIADEIDGAVGYRRSLWEYQRFPTDGWRSRTLTHIVDTLHFAPSNASRLVQAADMVAYLWARIDSCADKENERAAKANRDLWDLVDGRVYSRNCWYP
jgi:Protein of unknown function (DUF3800)